MSAGPYKISASINGRIDGPLIDIPGLQQNLAKCRAERQRKNRELARMGSTKFYSEEPNLADIDKTHYNIFYPRYKPYIMVGNEYYKTTPKNGSLQFGSDITFSIEQFAEFFHDMVVHVRISSFQGAQQTAPALGDYEFYTDSFGNAITAETGNFYNLVKWCDYPGERLFNLVSFDVNGTTLDKYNSYQAAAKRKMFLKKDKKRGYDLCIGQEVEQRLINGPERTQPSNTSNIAADPLARVAPILTDPLDAYTGTNVITFRPSCNVFTGAQTPKLLQPQLDLWIKLRFWFCDDPKLSIPSVALPYGQRYIKIKLEEAINMVSDVPNIFGANVGATATSGIAPVTFTRLSTATYTGTITTYPTISLIEMYTNNITVMTEIHHIYLHRIGFTMIRIYQEFNTVVTESSRELHISSLKWPVEYIIIGFVPQFNTDRTNNPEFFTRDWHKFTRIIEGTYNKPCRAYDGVDTAFVNVEDVTKPTFESQVIPITQLGVTASGLDLSREFDQQFYSRYQFLHYGPSTIVTPDDDGLFLITFSLVPGEYQPTGHLNCSRANNVHIKWQSDYLSNSAPAIIRLCIMSINFLLIADGSANIRYVT